MNYLMEQMIRLQSSIHQVLLIQIELVPHAIPLQMLDVATTSHADTQGDERSIRFAARALFYVLWKKNIGYVEQNVNENRRSQIGTRVSEKEILQEDHVNQKVKASEDIAAAIKQKDAESTTIGLDKRLNYTVEVNTIQDFSSGSNYHVDEHSYTSIQAKQANISSIHGCRIVIHDAQRHTKEEFQALLAKSSVFETIKKEEELEKLDCDENACFGNKMRKECNDNLQLKHVNNWKYKGRFLMESNPWTKSLLEICSEMKFIKNAWKKILVLSL